VQNSLIVFYMIQYLQGRILIAVVIELLSENNRNVEKIGVWFFYTET